METLENWQKEVLRLFDKIKNHKKAYEIKVNNITLTVLPNVFSPKYFTDSLWFAEELSKIVKKKSLLEIGTGTGIIAIFCALKGAKVIATDINANAVENAKINCKKYKLNIDVRKGNLYSPLKKTEKFDFIFWNHPFNKYKKTVKDILLKSGFDKNYNNLREYVKGASKHLNKNGKLLLGTGNFADLEEIKRIANINGYILNLLKKKEFPLTKGGKIKNEYLIYEFVKKE